MFEATLRHTTDGEHTLPRGFGRHYPLFLGSDVQLVILFITFLLHVFNLDMRLYTAMLIILILVCENA
ncbi:hypothetical protein J6590_024274 [Homalodisca vitripennis]|nr:hypothetical protein J6590_024274 [Homalodisca vitripennis]